MDLRKERTKQSIRDAYTVLRKKKPIEKITVKEIADLALINKATFYRHYVDIYQLANEIEDEYIERIVDMIKKGTPVTDLVGHYTSILEDIYTSFPFLRKDIMIDKHHKRFMELICERRPDLRDNVEKRVAISAGILGSIIAFSMHHDEDAEEVKRGLTRVAKMLEEAFS